MFCLSQGLGFKNKTVGKETTKPGGLAGCYDKQVAASQSVCRKAFRSSQWGARAVREAAQWGASSAVFESPTGPKWGAARPGDAQRRRGPWWLR